MVYDCTFLCADDRDEPTHATIDDILDVARTRRPETLVLHHLSLRYDRTTLADQIRLRLRVDGEPFRTFLWDEDRVCLIAPSNTAP